MRDALRDAANLQPPALGPQLPVYPHLRQMVRAAARAGPVWTATVQQWDGQSRLRSREWCYLWEPNGLDLAPGATYRARLLGSYTGTLGPLPLYFVGLACCVPGSFPPASSVSSSVSSCSLGSQVCATLTAVSSSSPAPSSISLCSLRSQVCATLTPASSVSSAPSSVSSCSLGSQVCATLTAVASSSSSRSPALPPLARASVSSSVSSPAPAALLPTAISSSVSSSPVTASSCSLGSQVCATLTAVASSSSSTPAALPVFARPSPSSVSSSPSPASVVSVPSSVSSVATSVSSCSLGSQVCATLTPASSVSSAPSSVSSCSLGSQVCATLTPASSVSSIASSVSSCSLGSQICATFTAVASSSSSSPVAGGVIGDTCCGCAGMPFTLNATFTAASGTCAGLLGLTIPISYIGHCEWQHTVTTSLGVLVVNLLCNNGVWRLGLTINSNFCFLSPSSAADFVRCSPPEFDFLNKSVAGCCVGTISVIITA